jgi:hypothetical protein
MTLKTRGSSTLDKAQRRLASIKSIDENLDLGHGLTVGAYAQTIEALRNAIATHNTLVSTLDESRRNVAALEQNLTELSTRMLSGVSTKYGNNSNEYRKAGGTLRKKQTGIASPLASAPTPLASTAFMVNRESVSNGSTNGKVTQST